MIVFSPLGTIIKASPRHVMPAHSSVLIFTFHKATPAPSAMEIL